MDNNKLGLKIIRINQGYTDLLEINGDQIWTKNVWDIRKELENIDNLDGSSAVLMLTGVDTGQILTVASPIEGRITDCISAWIHISATINVSGKELVEIVDAVKKEILASERNDERLNQLFSKPHDAAPAAKMTIKSSGDKCAFRYYGIGAKYQLYELLNDMCQSYYKNYKSVFLLDKSTKFKYHLSEENNLSDRKVYPMVIVDPPDQIDSFIPYIEEKPFSEQIYAIEEDIIKIVWKRNGYLPIETETTICQDIEISIPTSNQFIRVIPFDTIQVVDEWGQSINDYELYVEKNLIKHGQQITIRESTINKVLVEISAEGYEHISKEFDLTQRVKIKLAKETYSYEFPHPLKKSGVYLIKIPSKKKLEDSPVKGCVTEKGYVTHNNKNYLRFKPLSRKFWITCLICAIMLLLGGYVIIADRKEINDLTQKEQNLKENNKNLQMRLDEYSSKSSGSDDEIVKIAISYLDMFDVWNKPFMEQFPPLKGLWDAMNERKFDNILGYKHVLGKSRKFQELENAIQNCNKDFQGMSYANSGDYDITVKRYIEKLK